MSTDRETLVAEFDRTWRGVVATCGDLTEEQWQTPTALPGWSVKDNVSHIVSEEALLLGDPAPAHELPPDLTHLRSDFARALEIPIDYRRSRSGGEVLAELQSVAARRLAVLRDYDENSLDDEVDFAGRLRPLRDALGIRLFDCWIHEQDIRRALQQPGNVDSAAAHLTLRRLVNALSHLSADVPEAAGRTVVIKTTGPVTTTTTLRLGPNPTCVDGADRDADVVITTSFETFIELTTGRASYDDRSSDVVLTGDDALGHELVRHFAVTP